MKTHTEICEIIRPHLQREFDPNETMQWLTSAPRQIYMSWGVSKKVNYNNKALLLKVSGYHFKGWVSITLAWDDTYTLHYITNDGIIKEKQGNVYCDMLRDVIDDRIERIEEYHI